MKIPIPQTTPDAVLNIALDTVQQDRQALVFCNTRRGAESQAEQIALKLPVLSELAVLSEKVLKGVGSATRQCKRLAKCVERGIAFHHSGLTSSQRRLIEEGFRDSRLHVICSTPSLAMGVDLPAFRVVVRDLKRYSGGWGMSPIPVLEYHQQIGRAGRPGKETEGQAITIAVSDGQKKEIRERYVEGEPEEILSKLAVEPVFRTYVLTLIATEYCLSESALKDFFDRTFYAHSYGDSEKIHWLIGKTLEQLEEWEFIRVEGGKKDDGFVSASDLGEEGSLVATPVGKRVSELYLDPYTAQLIIEALKRATGKKRNVFSFLQMVSSTLEMRPLLRVRVKELDWVEELVGLNEEVFITSVPMDHSSEYEDFLNSVKTAFFFDEWMNEKSEEELLNALNVRPGEIHAKLDAADWLVYAAEEMCVLLKFHDILKELKVLRTRLRHGAKEELLGLLRLRNIGRVRARKLFRSGIKDVAGVKSVSLSRLEGLLGRKVAADVKRQAGQEEVGPDLSRYR